MWDLGFIFSSGKKIVLTFVLLFLCVGFRTYPNAARWVIDTTSPKLWVQFCDRTDITNNDLPQGDSLYGQTLNFTTLSQSILDDYNNVQTTFVRLYDASTDGSFGSSNTANRVIKVCYGNVPAGFSGWTQRTTSRGAVTDCSINISSDLKSSARKFTRTVAHELGHCLGLDHPQDTNYAIMSYFATANRLQDDDKMGVTYLYPADPSYAQETPTFGLSCAGRGN